MPDLLDMVGQDAALAVLQRAFAGSRRPHAYLLAGPEGVGRRTMAEGFARLLLCARPAEQQDRSRLPDLPEDFPLRQPCGQCPSCRAADGGVNPDLHVITKELARYHDEPQVRERKMQELSIDVVRQFLIAPAGLVSSGGRGKVFIVLQADLMSDAAQNALLKTLEEPPPGVTILLVAPRPTDLLATVRSRCQVIRFRPLPVEFVRRRLTEEKVPAEEAQFLSALTAGSLGRAIRLARENLLPFKGQLLDRLGAGGAGLEADVAELLTATAEKLARRFTSRDDQLAGSVATRQAGEIILEVLSSVYRDALTVSTGAGRPLVHADQAQAVGALARRFDPAQLADALTDLARCQHLLWRNVNPKLLWDNVAVTCATAAALDA